MWRTEVRAGIGAQVLTLPVRKVHSVRRGCGPPSAEQTSEPSIQEGNQRIVGGTGKYAGVAGNCPYTTNYLPDNWLVSTSACEWRKP